MLGFQLIKTRLFSLGVLCVVFLHASGVDSRSVDSCKNLDEITRTWLEKLSCTKQNVRHAGIIAVKRSSGLDLYRIVNSDLETDASNSLTRLHADGEQFLSDKQGQYCLAHAESQKISLEGCALAEHYHTAIVGSSQVSGRATTILALDPRDQHRYSYRLQLDKKTGLILSMSTLSHSYDVLDDFRYATIDFESTSFELNDISIASNEISERIDNKEISPWGVDWVPPGFKYIADSDRFNKNKSFTDGIASFTIFLDPLAGKADEFNTEGAVLLGSTTSYVNTIKFATDQVLVTIIGDIPIKTARRISKSIRKISN